MVASAGIAVGSVIVFVAVVLWFYNWRPTVGTVVLGLGWMALVGAAVLLVRAALTFDLTRQVDMAEALSDRRRLELDREKKLLLKAIKEIEFDQGMGKIDDAEASITIERYRRRALEIMKLLDVEDGGAAYEQQIEKEVARRVARVKQVAQEKDEKKVDRALCPSCSTRNDGDAAFCKKCGTKLGGGAGGQS
jgi:hypothetical protein